MWKTVNSVYKSTSKNIKKLSKSITNMPNVSQSIQKINIASIITAKPSQQTQLQKSMKSVFTNKKPVMPIKKMSVVAQMSYESQNFDIIYELMLQKLRVFKYNSKQAKQTLNTLILLCYLIKNGPSGFVDQFRQQMSIFQEHSQLLLQNAFITDDKQIQKLKILLVEIRQRAKYIVALLTDKKKLLRQKQLAMQIKRKIIEGMDKEGSLVGNNDGERRGNLFMGTTNEQQSQKRSSMQKVDSFLQHYVWKYWNKLDEKMQSLTQKIIDKIDQYLDLQQPQSFQIQEIEQVQQEQEKRSGRTETDFEENVKREEGMFLKEKNDLDVEVKQLEVKQQGPLLNTDLI